MSFLNDKSSDPATMNASLNAPGAWQVLLSRISHARWPDSLAFNLLFSFVIGGLYAFHLLASARLNPSNVHWMQGDTATYYIGWELFRQDPHLRWPLTYTTRVGYPIGDSVALMDLNPLLAIFFKAFSALLPHDFQYLGLESVLACGLQLFFALRLFRLIFASQAAAAGLASLFFLLSPPMNLRLGAHYSLSNQWLLTASLLPFCLVYSGRPISIRKFVLEMLALASFAVAINPYLAFQVLLALTAAAIGLKIKRRVTLPGALGLLAALVVTSGIVAYVVGFIIPGGQGYAGGGYRWYSMNLLAPFDPSMYGSMFVKQLPYYVFGQYEGYCYLGAGLLLLAALVAVLLVVYPARIPRLQWRSAAPLLICSFVLTLMALSTRVTLGSRLVIDLDPKEHLTPALAVLRSSGRLFWLPYYALSATILALPYFLLKRRWAVFVLAVALVVQVVDTMPLRRRIHAAAVSKSSPGPLRSPIWSKLGSRYGVLMIMPPFQCSPEASPGGDDGADIFGLLAAAQNMQINSYRSGRMTGVSAKFHCQESVMSLTRAPVSLSPTSAYVVTPAIATIISAGGGKCNNLDGFVLCLAKDDFGLGTARWESPNHFWIRDEFKTILLRDPTDREMLKWATALDAQAVAPADVVLQLVTSKEFEEHSIPIFWAYLDTEGRWPTRAEWLQNTRAKPSTIPTHVRTPHDHVQAVVEMLYFAILKRDPDPPGLSDWTRSIRTYGSVRNVAVDFFESPEYRAHGYRY